ncbi:hypothetical protein [Streptomyces sp. NPDC019793]
MADVTESDAVAALTGLGLQKDAAAGRLGLEQRVDEPVTAR